MASPGSDDEDLKTAIAMSLADHESGKASNQITPSAKDERLDYTINDATMSSVHPAITTFAGLDRKAMEAERLARLSRKRERSISPPPLSSRKAPKVEATTVSLPSGAMLRSFTSTVNQDQRGRKSEVANAANRQMRQPHQNGTTQPKTIQDSAIASTRAPHGLTYPNGVVKKTWAFGFERTNNDVKIEEVLEPLTLRTALLSAFQWDIDWIMSKLKTPESGGTTKCIFVMEAKTDELRQQMLQETEHMRSYLRLCFPPMYTPINCMHSKLMLLFHEKKLRIAVPTANLLNFDWGETGKMENSVFMIDLPRLPSNTKTSAKDLTTFGTELLYFLRRQNVDKDVRDGLLNFDFSATSRLMFIHTVGGSHFGDEAERTGLPGLSRAVRELKLKSDSDLHIDFATSSVGNLKDAYLSTLHAAAQGENLFERAEALTLKKKSTFFTPATKTAQDSKSIRDKVLVYFPTYDTVRASKAGAVGSICFKRNYYESSTFPKSALRDYLSTRTGLLSHNKILYARGKKRSSNENQAVAWVYVGSANISESAWGGISYNQKEKAWKVTCRNWECGVLLPASKEFDDTAEAANGEEVTAVKRDEEDDIETESEDEGGSSGTKSKAENLIDISVFDGVAQPPFAMPGASYRVDQEPWFFDEWTR